VVVDVTQHKVLTVIPLPQYPHSVFLTPDATQAFVTLPFLDQVYVIDTLSGTVARTIGIRQPYAVAFNATATRAYITSGTTPGSVKVIDTATDDVIRSIAVGPGPVDIVISPDGVAALVANFAGNSISAIDLATERVKTVAVDGIPRALMYVE
jgi:YVTN family beta-propeller protein